MPNKAELLIQPIQHLTLQIMSDDPENNFDSDGRLRRAKRSRKAIIEATLSLYSDGIYVPTAQLVADRSGLG